MPTECSRSQLEFQVHSRRKVTARFNGGEITSEAGMLLFGELERRRKIIGRFAECFTDSRERSRVEHSLSELLSQRLFALVMGYEDLIDHDLLRRDPVLALISGKDDPSGESRKRSRDAGCALASRSTLNRLEGAPIDGSGRYQKITYSSEAIDELLVELFVEAHKREPRRIVLDIDATDDALHGKQEGRFFHGYYRHYCYLPLYIMAGDYLLCSRLRTSRRGAAHGVVEEIARIVERIRKKWEKTQIILRGDGDFSIDALMTWCETNGVDYVFGKRKNARLERKIRAQMERVCKKALRRGEAVRQFCELRYRTRISWSKKRRVVAKAEHLPKGANPRFVVTSLAKEDFDARSLYEDLYCARGDMENRIKEQQLDLFADRTSCHRMAANQLRLYMSSLAYVLLNEFRRLALRGTALARARADTIRLKLLKIGAIVRATHRRFWVQLSSAYPYRDLFETAYRQLQLIEPLRC